MTEKIIRELSNTGGELRRDGFSRHMVSALYSIPISEERHPRQDSDVSIGVPTVDIETVEQLSEESFQCLKSALTKVDLNLPPTAIAEKLLRAIKNVAPKGVGIFLSNTTEKFHFTYINPENKGIKITFTLKDLQNWAQED